MLLLQDDRNAEHQVLQKSYILLRQPGLHELVLDRKQRLIGAVLFALEQQTQQVCSIHVWKVLSERHLQQDNRIKI